MTNPYLKQYQQNQIITSNPEQLLVLLYDGAINYLNKAKAAYPTKDIEIIHNNVIAAQKIIAEFMSTIKMDTGGEFAQNLHNFYKYLYGLLVDANIKRDEAALDEVLRHLKSLRDAWKQAIVNVAKEKNADLQSDSKANEESNYKHIDIADDDEDEN